SMVVRQARAEATRQSLIVAAVELFGEVGYGDTDMIDVIERAKATKGTCYYYFPSKRSLAAAIIEQANAGIAAAMAPIWESEAPPMHRLIMATFRFVAVTESDPIVRVGYQLRQAMNQISEAGAKSYANTESVFASALKGAAADGHVRPEVNPKEAAYTLFTALVGCRLLCDAFDESPFVRLTQVWRTFLRSVAPEDVIDELTRVVRAEAKRR
nr:TetR/AcrR family transcriptional regulator [Mycobacterium sp.]